ncbi:MAG: translation elongation factor-like protein [Spirochaetes bacterium]|jgi:putative protease|nr:translation elongation factor-like protein [Spirochaetota bacterium]
MENIKIGIVIKFFSKPSVAAMEITDGTLNVGDRIRIHGATTDFEQSVDSMQVENTTIMEAKKGDRIGIKVSDKVREHDIVYKIV